METVSSINERTWIFLLGAARPRFTGAPEPGERASWRLTHSADRVQTDDRVWLWSPRRRELVGWGKVAEENPEEPQRSQRTVAVEVGFHTPLAEKELAREPELQSLSILRQNGSVNHRVTTLEARALCRLAHEQELSAPPSPEPGPRGWATAVLDDYRYTRGALQVLNLASVLTTSAGGVRLEAPAAVAALLVLAARGDAGGAASWSFLREAVEAPEAAKRLLENLFAGADPALFGMPLRTRLDPACSRLAIDPALLDALAGARALAVRTTRSERLAARHFLAALLGACAPGATLASVPTWEAAGVEPRGLADALQDELARRFPQDDAREWRLALERAGETAPAPELLEGRVVAPLAGEERMLGRAAKTVALTGDPGVEELESACGVENAEQPGTQKGTVDEENKEIVPASASTTPRRSQRPARIAVDAVEGPVVHPAREGAALARLVARPPFDGPAGALLLASHGAARTHATRAARATLTRELRGRLAEWRAPQRVERCLSSLADVLSLELPDLGAVPALEAPLFEDAHGACARAEQAWRAARNELHSAEAHVRSGVEDLRPLLAEDTSLEQRLLAEQRCLGLRPAERLDELFARLDDCTHEHDLRAAARVLCARPTAAVLAGLVAPATGIGLGLLALPALGLPLAVAGGTLTAALPLGGALALAQRRGQRAMRSLALHQSELEERRQRMLDPDALVLAERARFAERAAKRVYEELALERARRAAGILPHAPQGESVELPSLDAEQQRTRLERALDARAEAGGVADETLPAVLWCELDDLPGPALLLALEALREVCARSTTSVLLVADPGLLGLRLDEALRLAGRSTVERERLLAPYPVCAHLDAAGGGHLARLLEGSAQGEASDDPLSGFDSEFPVLEPGAERVLRALEPLAPSAAAAQRLALSWLRLRLGLSDRERAALDGGPQDPPERGVALAMLAAVLGEPEGARGLALELARIETGGTWGELIEHLKSVAASRRDLSPELLNALAQGLEAAPTETRRVPLARARSWYAAARRCARD